MPPSHQAARIGPHTRTLMEALMLRRRYPQQAISYRSVASILDKGLDRQASEQPDRPIIHHGNIRGPEYFP